jgi:hypothetical protein
MARDTGCIVHGVVLCLHIAHGSDTGIPVANAIQEPEY